jgi:hypothetical protein
LQVIQGRIRTAYTYEDLVYEVRNPRTDVTACGYGYGETEALIRVVTYLLNTMTYNGSFFDKNSIPRGILHLSGQYSQEDLAAFKRYWQAMVRGIQNVHNVPVLVSKDQESKAEFAEIGGQLDEMSFSRWMSFLTSVACAVYGISPEEVSMESYSAGKSSLSGDDTGEKISHGADKGLRPLLGYYESIFSDFIIRTFSDQYCFRWTGLDDDDQKEQFELRKLVLTVNETRSQLGYDPIEGPLGDAPLNPALLGPWQATQQGMQGDFGDGGSAGGQPGEDGPPGGGDSDADKGRGEAGERSPRDFGSPRGAPAPDGEDMAKSCGLPPLEIFRVDP